MRDRRGIVVGLAFATLCVAPAAAKLVRYPAAHPLVQMTVPDDWSVAETPLGLELQPPQKDSLVLAATVSSDKKSLDNWSRRALERMRAAGISFARQDSAKRGPAGRGPAETDVATKADAAAERLLELSAGNGYRPYTFKGVPSVDSPVAAAEQKDGVGAVGPQEDERDLPTISTIDPRAATTSALHATGHYAYRGGRLNGQPVDVELAVFPLDGQRRFLTEQASGPTDARGVMIVRSLRALSDAGK